jgi:hypothetical protein
MRLGKADSGKGGVDHINGKSWDCRKSNLRAATNSQNQANRGVSIRSTTGIKGVFKNTPTPKWKNPKQPYKSSIRVRGNSIFLGYFDTIEQAKEAYDMASAEHFGEYARKG